MDRGTALKGFANRKEGRERERSPQDYLAPGGKAIIRRTTGRFSSAICDRCVSKVNFAGLTFPVTYGKAD